MEEAIEGAEAARGSQPMSAQGAGRKSRGRSRADTRERSRRGLLESRPSSASGASAAGAAGTSGGGGRAAAPRSGVSASAAAWLLLPLKLGALLCPELRAYQGRLLFLDADAFAVADFGAALRPGLFGEPLPRPPSALLSDPTLTLPSGAEGGTGAHFAAAFMVPSVCVQAPEEVTLSAASQQGFDASTSGGESGDLQVGDDRMSLFREGRLLLAAGNRESGGSDGSGVKDPRGWTVASWASDVAVPQQYRAGRATRALQRTDKARKRNWNYRDGVVRQD